MALFRVISKILLVKSFLLGAAVLWVWVRSYSIADRIAVEVGSKSSSITAANGLVIYKAEADGTDSLRLANAVMQHTVHDPELFVDMLPGDRIKLKRTGFSYTRDARSTDGGGLVIILVFPMWLLFLLTGGKAVLWTTRKLVKIWLAEPKESGWCAMCQMDRASSGNLCLRCGSPVFNRKLIDTARRC